MQQPFIFIDRGNGWESLYNHLEDVTALADFTIRWGVEEIGNQPDPAVMTLTIRDRTGTTAGDVLTLAGARIIVQLSAQPTYNDLDSSLGIYAACHVNLSDLHSLYKPPEPSVTTTSATTIFDGIIASGGTIEKIDDQWNIKLSASSRMILWKRLASMGPTSTDSRYTELHWVGTPGNRLSEMVSRAKNANAPKVDTTGFDLPTSVAPYDQNTFPTQLELLHRLYASHAYMPMWCEYPDGASSIIKGFPTTRPVPVAMGADGQPYILDRGNRRDPLSAATIPVSDKTLTIPAPVTQIVIKTKAVKYEDNKLSVSDAEIDFTSDTLPTNLTTVQSSLTQESDVITIDESSGLISGTAWKPTDNERKSRSYQLTQMNTRLHPTSLIFDSRHIDPVVQPELYTSAPGGAQIISGSMYQELVTSSGYPLAVTPFVIIGGTINFTWINGKPVLKHSATPAALPRYPLDPTIDDMAKVVTATYDEMPIPISMLTLVNQFS